MLKFYQYFQYWRKEAISIGFLMTGKVQSTSGDFLSILKVAFDYFFISRVAVKFLYWKSSSPISFRRHVQMRASVMAERSQLADGRRSSK